MSVTAADLLNDRVLPFFEEQEVSLLRMSTDRGTEYCGNPEHHEYELYLALGDIDHTRTKAQSPPDQRDLRAVSQDHSQRVLSGSVYEEIVQDDRRVSDRLGING